MPFNQIGFNKQLFDSQTLQGETNGTYAAVTENNVQGTDGMDIQSFFDNVPAFLSGVTRTANQIAAVAPQLRNDVQRITDSVASESGSSPGVLTPYTGGGNISAQWDMLNFWEKFAVVLAVAVVVKQFVLK